MDHNVTEKTDKPEILCVNYNQDQGMFAIGTDTGFRVYSTGEFQEKFFRDLKGGIRIVEMLYRSNILALVGGGIKPRYPENKVILWDDHLLKCIAEMSFRDKIRNVKLKNDKVIVVLEKKIFVYNFSDLKLIDQIETCPNQRGICAINVEGDYTILATPDKILGRVLITNYGKTTFSVLAHQSPISFLALNASGSRLATTSEKGTVIRIYDTSNGESIQELRRGSDYATITSLAFDQYGLWLACSSDQGTIHIFGLKGGKEADQPQLQQEQAVNPQSKFKFLGSMIPILKSEWSFAQFRINEPRCKITFTNEPNTIVSVTYEGNYYKASFDPDKGGDCTKIKQVRLFNTEQKQT